MEDIFGISAVLYAIFLATIVSLILIAIVAAAWFNRLSFRLAHRSIFRRPSRFILIIIGLTLSTILIASAFGTGDTIAHSIRQQGVRDLREIDQIVSPVMRLETSSLLGTLNNASLTSQEYERLRLEIVRDPLVAGVAPLLTYQVSVIHPSAGLGEPISSIFASNEEYDTQFGFLVTAEDQLVAISDLEEGEVYLNEVGAERLLVSPGDQIEIYVQATAYQVRVKSIVKNDGLIGSGPIIVQTLPEAQMLLQAPNVISHILVTNAGDAITGAQHSSRVTENLRALLINEPIFTELVTLLNTPEVRTVIAAKAEETQAQVGNNEPYALLHSVLGETADSVQLRAILSEAGTHFSLAQLDLPTETILDMVNLLGSLSSYQILPVKTMALSNAEQLGNFATSIFIVLGTFAILSGMLLIFLIFMTLAAERKSELGLLRGLGMQRRYVIQMFVTEGLVYDLLAAVLGVGFGVGLAYLMVGTITSAVANFSSVDTADSLQFFISPYSLIISFCIGVILTFVIVTLSSWHISRLNIVAAIRNVPEHMLSPRKRGWLSRLGMLILSMWLLSQAVPFAIFGYSGQQKSLVLVGVSLLIIAVGFLLRWVLDRTRWKTDRKDRLAHTFIGLGLLIFWVLPFPIRDTLLGIEEMLNGAEIFVVSGFFLVLGSIWTIVANADGLSRLLQRLFSKAGSLGPTLKIAIMYPLEARFRTGLTLAMFALVIFTVIVISVLAQTSGQSFSDQEALTGGFHIEASISGAHQIGDLTTAAVDTAGVPPGSIKAVGALAELPISVRQVDGQRPLWTPYRLVGYDEAYISQVRSFFTFNLRAAGYENDDQVWEALLQRDDVVIVSGLEVPFRQQVQFVPDPPPGSFWLEGVYQEDSVLPAIRLALRHPHTGEVKDFTVIGVLDWVGNVVGAVQMSEHAFSSFFNESFMPQRYFIVIEDQDQATDIARALERAFLSYGMNAISTEQAVGNLQAGNRTIIELIRSFLALGLIVGIVGLGVVSARSVVERRQQIGMLRAIGYTRQHILLIFLLESSFISLIGIGLGVCLGLIAAWNMIADFTQNQSQLAAQLPWMEIGVIVLGAFLFSLAAVIFPAIRASLVYPAEALRYE